MNNRQLKILYYFFSNQGPCKSSDIAKELKLSSRTIRDTIKDMQPLCVKNGFTIHSKRNYGFEIQITDAELYKPFYDNIQVTCGVLSQINYNENESFLYIARKLVSIDNWVKIDDLAEELNFSRSSLSPVISDITSYFKNRQLSIIHKKGKGIKISGTEINFRLSIIQLIGPLHYRTSITKDNTTFNKYVYYEPDLFLSIRKEFMLFITKNCLHLTDAVFTWLTFYLVIAMNRRKQGHTITQDNSLLFLKNTPYFYASSKIFHILHQCFPLEFDTDIHEIYQFAALLISCSDIKDSAYFLNLVTASPINEKLCKISKECLQFLDYEFNLALDIQDSYYEEFKVNIAQILFKHYFHVETKKTFGGFSNNKLSHLSPLLSFLGYKLTKHLETKWKCSLSTDDYFRFINFFLSYLLSIEVPIKKKKILITSGAGLAYSSFIARQIRKEYGKYIDSYLPCELYEIRNLDTLSYDFIITNLDIPNNSPFYSYDIPYYNVNLEKRNEESKLNLNQAFSDCFIIDDYFVKDEHISFYENTQFFNLSQIYQFVVYKNCKYPDNYSMLINEFENIEDTLGFIIINETLILIGNKKEYGKECLDVFSSDGKFSYKGNRISYVIFVSLEFSSLMKLRIAEIYLMQLLNDCDIEILRKEKSSYLKRLVNQSLMRFK